MLTESFTARDPFRTSDVSPLVRNALHPHLRFNHLILCQMLASGRTINGQSLGSGQHRFGAEVGTNSMNALISGAGIAESTLAFWLRKYGFAPTLVECAPALRTGGYVIDFWGLAYDIAEKMGLVPDIARLGYHMRELRIVDDYGRRLSGFGVRVFRELTGGRYNHAWAQRPLEAHLRQDQRVVRDHLRGQHNRFARGARRSACRIRA
jgi:hypothetical protein